MQSASAPAAEKVVEHQSLKLYGADVDVLRDIDNRMLLQGAAPGGGDGAVVSSGCPPDVDHHLKLACLERGILKDQASGTKAIAATSSAATPTRKRTRMRPSAMSGPITRR